MRLVVIITLATTVAIMATVTRRGGIKEQKLPTFFPARHRNATLVAMVTRRPTTMDDDDDGDEMADEKSHFFSDGCYGLYSVWHRKYKSLSSQRNTNFSST